MVDTFGTGKVSEELITEKLSALVDLRPAALIRRFNLRTPIYAPLAAYGHMGREELNVGWETTDIAESLAELLK
jgi:S-adenosylmethionine synthetase